LKVSKFWYNLFFITPAGLKSQLITEHWWGSTVAFVGQLGW